MHSSCMKLVIIMIFILLHLQIESSIPIMVCGAVCSHYTALNSSAFLVLLSVVVYLSLPLLSVASYCCQGT